MTEEQFGALKLDEAGYWTGHIALDFFGKQLEPCLMIDSCYESQSEISSRQKETCWAFLEKWPEVQGTVVKEILRYYNEELDETGFQDIAF